MHCKRFYMGRVLSKIQGKTKQLVSWSLPSQVVLEVQCWCSRSCIWIKIIGQQGARKVCQLLYIFKSSNIHLKQLGMLVCALGCKRLCAWWPSAGSTYLAASKMPVRLVFLMQMLQVFNCFCVWIGGRALWFIILIICVALMLEDWRQNWNAVVLGLVDM